MLEYLPNQLLIPILNLEQEKLTEIRLRANKSAFVQFDGKYVPVANGYKVKFSDIEEIVLKLTKRSVYAYSDTIRKGYIAGEYGERIGLTGKFYYNDDKLRSIGDFTSLCIRIPHEVTGCAEVIKNTCFLNGIKSVLIVAPPGGGKTTFLRDSARIISDYYKLNVLLIDEKNEFFGSGRFNVGERTDVMTYAKKSYGFDLGVLNMRPDVIITDELSEETDIFNAKKAVLSGVKIMASAHAENLDDLLKKTYYKKILKEKIFDCCIILSAYGKIGRVLEVLKL